MYLEHYLKELGSFDIPNFLYKYLNTPSLVRLKSIGYFCGMDYASSDIYDFREYISRFDHSLSVGLMTYKLTNDKVATLAGLFHDVATPCFSHVIDYMNGDYEKQESTEEYTGRILKNDMYLKKCLMEDNIDVNDVIDFKKYTIVDNERPKACVDRIDGVILTGIGWTKNISISDITNVVNDIHVYINEYGEQEIGFGSLDVALRVLDVSKSIDIFCHSREDNYMMQLLAQITKYAIDRNYILYDDLYSYNEALLFDLFKSKNDIILDELIFKFQNIKKEDILDIDLPKIKRRRLNLIVDGKRI